MSNAWMIRPLPIVDTSTATQDPGYAASNVGNDYAGVTWRTSASGYRAILIDLGSDQLIDAVMIFGLTSSSTSPAGVNIYRKVEGGSSYQAVLFNEPLFAGSAGLTSGAGVGLYSFPAVVTARYVLIEFPSDYNGPLVMARIVIGRRIQLERNFSFGASFGVRDLGSVDFSRRGVLLRTRGAKLRTASLTFSYANKDEADAKLKPLLEQLGNTECLALVTDPAPDAQRQNRCYFGPLVGDLGQTWRTARAWETKINLVSLF